MEYMLRVYHTSGPDKGNLDREEFFDSFLSMDKRYKELFRHELFGANPTAWRRVPEFPFIWERLHGY